MPRTEEQNKKIREERKEAIKDAALHLFADEGYHNTSVQKIAKKAEVSKGLLYNYFESKEDLLVSIIDDFVDSTYSYFDPDHDGILTVEEFFYFIEKSFEVVEQNPIHWKLYSTLAFQKDVAEIMAKKSFALAPKVFEIMLNFLKNKNCEDPEGEMLFFTSLTKGAIIQYIAAPYAFPLEKIKNKIIDFYKQKFKIS